MDKPKRKLAGGILLLAVLGIVYFVFLLKTNEVVNGAYNLDSYIDKIEAINSSVKVILDHNTYVHKREVVDFASRVALGAVAAKGVLQSSDWDGKSAMSDNGAIVTVAGGRIEYPKGYPEEQKIDASSLTGTSGIVVVDVRQEKAADDTDDAWLVGYYRISSNVYYLESALKSALENRARRSYDADKSMDGMEDAFDIRVFLISMKEDKDGRHALLYKSSELSDELHTAEELGITKDMLEAASERTMSMTAEELLDSFSTVKLDGTSWQAYIQITEGASYLREKMYLAYLIPETEFVSMTVEQTVVMLAVFLIIGITLLVWLYSLISLVRYYRLNEEQAQQLEFHTTVRKAFSMIAVGCAVFFVISALFMALFRLLPSLWAQRI